MKAKYLLITLLLIGCAVSASAAEELTADQAAKELSNPAGALASLFTSIEYYTYKGDLPDADDQDGFSFAFQPVLPFPVGDQGRKIIFRPLFTLPINQPVFKGDGFDSGDVNLSDITFDLVYAGNNMKNEHEGFLWGIGAAGTLPTGTDSDFAENQWRAGPEVFGGIITELGVFGGVLNHQWNFAGSNNDDYSATAGQYFYAIGLGNGWQIASGPNFKYDWEADSDQAWTLPVGTGLAKTTQIRNKKVKFQAQIQYFVEQPDPFGPEWLLKFSIIPVVNNPLAKLFR